MRAAGSVASVNTLVIGADCIHRLGGCLRPICGYGPIRAPADLVDTHLLRTLVHRRTIMRKILIAPVCVAAFLGLAALLMPDVQVASTSAAAARWLAQAR